MSERVQKVLSQWGIASRRHAEQMVLAGRVLVNSQTAQLGQKVDPAADQIMVDGVIVHPSTRPELIYLLLNKPAGIVSTCDDPYRRPTVLGLLPQHLRDRQGLHPVGRLDADSTGALLLTNDGDLTFHLTHPRHHVSKTYQVWVAGSPSELTLSQWRRGVLLDDRLTMPAEVTVLQRHSNHKTLLEIVLREGRNRQIRRVAEQLGHPVLQLHRLAIGSIHLQPQNLPALPLGGYRALSSSEISSVKFQIDLPSEVRSKLSEECGV